MQATSTTPCVLLSTGALLPSLGSNCPALPCVGRGDSPQSSSTRHRLLCQPYVSSSMLTCTWSEQHATAALLTDRQTGRQPNEQAHVCTFSTAGCLRKASFDTSCTRGLRIGPTQRNQAYSTTGRHTHTGAIQAAAKQVCEYTQPCAMRLLPTGGTSSLGAAANAAASANRTALSPHTHTGTLLRW